VVEILSGFFVRQGEFFGDNLFIAKKFAAAWRKIRQNYGRNEILNRLL
jgi:hypothetical protein